MFPKTCFFKFWQDSIFQQKFVTYPFSIQCWSGWGLLTCLQGMVDVNFGSSILWRGPERISIGSGHCFTLKCWYFVKPWSLLVSGNKNTYIRITCLCNVYPLTPLFYIEKLGYTGEFFSYFCFKTLIVGYMYPQSMFWAKIWKKYPIFHRLYCMDMSA